MFIPRTDREKMLHEALVAATTGERGSSSVCNYDVYDGGFRVAYDMSKDEAIGFAKGLKAAGANYAGYMSDPEVRCGAFVVYPDDRYGELIGTPEEV